VFYCIPTTTFYRILHSDSQMSTTIHREPDLKTHFLSNADSIEIWSWHIKSYCTGTTRWAMCTLKYCQLLHNCTKNGVWKGLQWTKWRWRSLSLMVTGNGTQSDKISSSVVTTSLYLVLFPRYYHFSSAYDLRPKKCFSFNKTVIHRVCFLNHV